MDPLSLQGPMLLLSLLLVDFLLNQLGKLFPFCCYLECRNNSGAPKVSWYQKVQNTE